MDLFYVNTGCASVTAITALSDGTFKKKSPLHTERTRKPATDLLMFERFVDHHFAAFVDVDHAVHIFVSG